MMPGIKGENLMKKTVLLGLVALLIAPEALSATTMSKSEAYTLCKQKVIEQGGNRVKLKKIRDRSDAWHVSVSHYDPLESSRTRTTCTINKKEYEVYLSSLL